MGEKTNTNTNTSTTTTVVSNSAEVIEKTTGLYETVNKSSRKMVDDINEQVEKRLEGERTRLEAQAKTIAEAEVATKLEKSVEERTKDLSNRIDNVRQNELNAKRKVIDAELEAHHANTRASSAVEDMNKAEEKLKDAKDENKELLKENKSLRQDLVDLQANVRTLSMTRDLQDGKLKDFDTALKAVKETYKESNTKIQEIYDATVDHLETIHEAELKKVATLAGEAVADTVIDLETEIAELNIQLKSANAKIRFLQDAQRDVKPISFVKKITLLFS